MPDEYIVRPHKPTKTKRSCTEVALMLIGGAALFMGWIWIAAWLVSVEGG